MLAGKERFGWLEFAIQPVDAIRCKPSLPKPALISNSHRRSKKAGHIVRLLKSIRTVVSRVAARLYNVLFFLFYVHRVLAQARRILFNLELFASGLATQSVIVIA